ncbi:MAG: hypothetical protein JSW27_15795 [Phycisphaerales bacterium]|nr:MAG: hypothetical protein JSW27_15795 [Phycisphaerales bacterium]
MPAVVVLAVTFASIPGYSAPQDSGRPEALKILPYPSKEEVGKSFFSSEGFRVSPLQTDDINQDFSNIDDLAWLPPLVKDCRVVLVGETHYFKYIHHLRNRLVFALNTFDRYPFVVVERQYSLTPFLNHYVGLPDEEAREFEEANRELFLNGFTADFEFLQHVRRWNSMYPEKRIQVGCHDIEHDASLAIQQVLRPYFADVNQALETNGQTIDPNVQAALGTVARIFEYRETCSPDDLRDAFGPMRDVLTAANDKGLVGRYPFLTTDYIERVIVNLESTYATYTQDLNQHRQQAMIRNLTDSRYLGASFTSGKVLLHAGAAHTATGPPNATADATLWEGRCLAHEFEPTRGKTFSLYVSGFAFSSLLGLEQIDLHSYGLLKDTAYGHMVAQVQQEAARGALAPDAAYSIDYEEELEGMTPAWWAFAHCLLRLAYQHQNCPLVFHHIPWASLTEQATHVSPEYAQTVATIQEMVQTHDLGILVPISPPTVLRGRGASSTSDQRMLSHVP